MRARVVPPYPSFTYVMSQIGDPPNENRAGSQEHGNVALKPYSKYDDNPFMRTVRYDYDESTHSSVSSSSIHPARGYPSTYPQRSKPTMSLPLVGKFLQKHASALSQRRKVSSAV